MTAREVIGFAAFVVAAGTVCICAVLAIFLPYAIIGPIGLLAAPPIAFIELTALFIADLRWNFL